MDKYDPIAVTQRIMDAIKKQYSELKTLNVMILGKTGVGKSTLINNMFNEELATVGVGKPVTKDIKKITKPGYPLAIFDTPGLELSGENDVDTLLEGVKSEIQKGIDSGDIGEVIHCVWYCISTPSHRFEDAEISFLKKLSAVTSELSVPTIVVLTQSYSKSDATELRRAVERENLDVVNIIPVLAEEFYIDEEYTAKAYGLDTLSQVMNTVIPESVQKTFVAVQKANVKLKKARARAVIAAAATTAAATGAIPIPGSDAAVLIPEQIAMLAGITVAFGLPVEQATMMTLITGTIGTAGATVLGKTVVANLLKLIPGAGSVVGGIISATTAAAITTALGETYISILEMVVEGRLNIADLQTDQGMEIVKDIFKEQLSIKRDSK